MVKRGSVDVAMGKRRNLDAEDIHLLPIILSHASGPISGVLIWAPPFLCHLFGATVWAECFVTGTLLKSPHFVYCSS